MNPLFHDFMGTVQAGGLTNPFGLAAVAATGKHESSFSPRNAFGAWSDPSERGAAGTSGGIMSWRNERLNNLRQFAARVGDDPRRPSPATQAQFFLNEDPALVQRLQNARSVEEAQRAINNAWRFAGYNRPGGEAAARLRTAQQFVPTFGGGGSLRSGNAAPTMAYASAQPPSRESAPAGEAGFTAAFGPGPQRSQGGFTPGPLPQVPRAMTLPAFDARDMTGLLDRAPMTPETMPQTSRRGTIPGAYDPQGFAQHVPTQPAVPPQAFAQAQARAGDLPEPVTIANAPVAEPLPQRREAAMPQAAPAPHADPRPVWLDPAGVGPDQTIGETMRRFGGLGGLGGMASQPPAQYASGGSQSPSSLAVGQSMPTPQMAAGGAPAAPQGGGGGFFNSPQFGTFLQALGASLMTSPRNAPLSGFPGAFAALQKASEGQAIQRQEAEALFVALTQNGVPEETAQAVMHNPAAAKMVLDGAREAQAARQSAEFGQQLSGAFGGGDFMPAHVPTPMSAPMPTPMPTPMQAPAASPDPVQGGAAQDPVGGDAPPAPAAQAPQQPVNPGTGNRTLDALMQRRANIARLAVSAPSRDDRDRAKILLDQIDADISRFAPTGDQRDYAFDQAQRMERGEPVITFAEWDAERSERRRPQTTVNVGGQEGAFAGAAGRSVADQTMEVLQNATTQRQRLLQYEQLGALLTDPSVYTGTGGEAIAQLKKLASTLFGIEGIEGAANADAVNRIKTGMFAGFRQEMLRGATSNADREMIMAIPPNLTDSDEGIRLTIEMQRRSTEAAQARAEILQDIIDSKPDGNLTLRDWNNYLRQVASFDVFDASDMDRIRNIARNNAYQSGPLAGLPLDKLNSEVLDLALQGFLTREDVEQIMRNEGIQ